MGPSRPLPSLLSGELEQSPAYLVCKALTLHAPSVCPFQPQALGMMSSIHECGEPRTESPEVFVWKHFGVGIPSEEQL